LFTNSYSERINISDYVNNNNENDEKNEEGLFNKLIKSKKNNFIMTAGTSSDTYNLNIEEMGLVPGHAYTLLNAKLIKNNKNNIKLVQLRNPWGNTEWSGDWCDNDNLWTKEIKKQIGINDNNNNNNDKNNNENNDDGSFWMSFDDFIYYYSTITICNIYEKYKYNYIHYDKSISEQGPALSKINIKNDNTHLYIMLHQKNPRIKLKDNSYQKTVINYILLIDNDFNYIKSEGNCDRNCCIEINLNKGIYYLISDINYRYIKDGKLHGYNISCYYNNEIELKKESQDKIENAFKTSIYSYCYKNLTPQNFANGKLFQSKSSKENEFPFNFIMFDNKNGIYDVTITDTLVFRNNRCADFYFDKDNKAEKLIKTISPNNWDFFIHMPYDFSSVYSFQLGTSCKKVKNNKDKNKKEKNESKDNNKKNKDKSKKNKDNDNNNNDNNNNDNNKNKNTDDIVNSVFSDEGEALDDEGLIKQFVHEADGGFYLGFENGSKKTIEMKLCLEGLYEVNNPKNNEIKFTANSMSRRVFTVKVCEGVKDNISFMFDYA